MRKIVLKPELFFRGTDDSDTVFHEKEPLTALGGYKLPDDAQYAEVKCGRNYSHLLYRLAGLLEEWIYLVFLKDSLKLLLSVFVIFLLIYAPALANVRSHSHTLLHTPAHSRTHIRTHIHTSTRACMCHMHEYLWKNDNSLSKEE